MLKEVEILKLNLQFLKTFLILAYKFKLANINVSLEFDNTKEEIFQNFVPHIEDTLKK